MFHNNYPRFAAGVVLKAEMLENMSLYQRNMLGILYGDYSDGIVAGAGLKVADGTVISISPGIIRYGGMLYHMYEETKIEAYPSGSTQYLKIRFQEQIDRLDEVCLESEIFIEECPPEEQNEMELCRFVLNEGAVLRDTYRDLKDYSTIHDTINIIETPYSAIGAPTFSPGFLLEFAREALKYSSTNPHDISFIWDCLKEKPIKRELIEGYLCIRLGIPHKSFSNQEIYRNFLKIMDLIKRGENGGVSRTGMQARRMLVD